MALQETPFTLAMLRGTTGESLMLPTPIAAAAHVAKTVDCTDAASTPHSCSSAWTSLHTYEGLGAGAGTMATAGAGAADVAAGVVVGAAAGVAVAAGEVAAEVGEGVATGIVTAGVGVGLATDAGA